ncbi:MAG: hypothetical protein HRU41_42050 [Saprospiraceae bacterium]|nr:hypothetical protein [Saprospiraceae bacterium]
MKALKKILKQYADDSRLLGESEPIPQPAIEQHAQLKQALKQLSDRKTKVFWTCSTLAALFFLTACMLIYSIEPSTSMLTLAIMLTTGMLVTGLLYFMLGAWKEKANAQLVLSLVEIVRLEQLNTMLVALLARI